ncbi:MAG: hypothetical protein COC10_07150 [Sphingobium sp.]|nr:MAG: hypothetical protein COC10_07150 [Sphingobium sp.]
MNEILSHHQAHAACLQSQLHSSVNMKILGNQPGLARGRVSSTVFKNGIRWCAQFGLIAFAQFGLIAFA